MPGAEAAPIPVTVIGGYLGAGKTTLLNRLLRDAGGERLAVLVNDFGAIAVDAALVDRRDGDTIRLTNGCVCCSLVGGFVEAMQQIAALDPPAQRLVVETSGVADPAAVAEWAHLPGFGLDAVVVLADAETVRRRAADPLVGRHVVRQLAGADVVVLNKIDLVDEATASAVAEWIRERAPGAPVIRTTEADVPLDVLLGTRRAHPGTADDGGPQHHHDHHDLHGDDDPHPRHLALTVTGPAAVERAHLERVLDAFGPELVRVKGFVELLDDGEPAGLHVVQCVGTRRRVRPHTSSAAAAVSATAATATSVVPPTSSGGPPWVGGIGLVVLGLADSDVVAATRRLADQLGARVVDRDDRS